VPATIEATYETIVARVERLPISSWHHRVRVVLGIAAFFSAFNAVATALAAPVLLGIWHISPVMIGLLISCEFTGQLIGATSFGWVGERCGRIFTTKLTLLIISVFGFASALSWGYASLLGFRFIQGMGMGGETPVASTYVNEIAKARGRGTFTMFYQLTFPLGFSIASLVGAWVIPHLGWRWMFIFGALPALVMAFVIQRSMPESPRWLARHQKLEAADRILTKLETQAFGGAQMPGLATTPVSETKGSVKFGDLFRGIYLKRTLYVWVMWFCASMIAWGVLLWLPSLLHTAYQLSIEQSLRYSVFGNVGVLIGGTLGALVIDRIGRKGLFELSFLFAALPLLVLGVLHQPSGRTVMILSSLGMLSITAAELALATYTSEIYPTRMRSLGHGVALSLGFASAISVSPLVGLLLSVTHEARAIFLSFAGIGFLGALVVLVFATETSGKVLEEISP